MRRSIRVMAVLLFWLVAAPAQANFHLWQMNELYSNADGSIQYLELTALAGFQQFLTGHTLQATDGATTRTFTFGSDLPGNTSGHRMLVGTQAFAALGIVQPDYTVPNGFFFRGGGTITFGEGADVWTHPALPSPPLSLNRDGSTATNSPLNFAGETGSIAGSNPPRLANISTRGQVLTGNDVMIAGFIVGGSASKTIVITAAGPSLANFGITNPLANPTLTLVRSSDNAVIATNDDWQSAGNAAQIQASGFAPSNTLEPAIMLTLAPGAYTAIVQGVGGGTGVGLVGVYEVDHPEVPLINISTRGQVLTGNDVMIAGFIIQGSGPQTVVITVAGPSLANYGISNPLQNPTLTLVRSSDQSVIATNDNWQSAANAAQIQASGFAPANTLEPAIMMTLAPGAYTAIVEGVGGGTGVGLVGVFTTP